MRDIEIVDRSRLEPVSPGLSRTGGHTRRFHVFCAATNYPAYSGRATICYRRIGRKRLQVQWQKQHLWRAQKRRRE